MLTITLPVRASSYQVITLIFHRDRIILSHAISLDVVVMDVPPCWYDMLSSVTWFASFNVNPPLNFVITITKFSRHLIGQSHVAIHYWLSIFMSMFTYLQNLKHYYYFDFDLTKFQVKFRSHECGLPRRHSPWRRLRHGGSSRCSTTKFPSIWRRKNRVWWPNLCIFDRH